MIVGPASSRPSTLAGSGAPALPSSSKKIAVSVSDAPRPPNSVGQCTPAQPPSFRRRCQSRAHAYSASSPPLVGRSPGGLLCSQSRSSSRNASCSSVNVRSMTRSGLLVVFLARYGLAPYRRDMRLAIAAALSALLVLPATAGAVIVPQQSIKGIELEMTPAQVREVLGSPDRFRTVRDPFAGRAREWRYGL